MAGALLAMCTEINIEYGRRSGASEGIGRGGGGAARDRFCQFSLRVHTHRSDSETQVETHIFGENQVKTQKSLATQVLPTVIRKGWVTKQLWL